MNGKLMSVDELLDWNGDTEYGPGPVRRVLKTHAPSQLAPWKGGTGGLKLGGAKIIVVVRNPKDACVSYFHHVQEVPEFKYTGGFEHMVSKLYLREKVEVAGFWSWYAGWEKASEQNPNIHWVSYEDLKRDGLSVVRGIANFLGLAVTDETISTAVSASDFETMKCQHEKLNETKEKQGKYIKPGHFRQGQSGSWRKVINGDLDKEFTDTHFRLVQQYGLKCAFDFGYDQADEQDKKQGA